MADGWTVYATARRIETVQDLAARGCKVLALDVCNEESMRAAVATIEAAEGAVGVLINNAGYGQEGAVEEVPMAEIRRQFETNFFGLTRLTQLVLPGMRRQRWGKDRQPELDRGARLGIDVVVIEPGPIKTQFGDTAINSLGGVGASQSPYARFNTAVASAVAKVIEQAITVGRPRTRYVVTAAGRFILGLRRWLPDRAFDAFLRTQFEEPAPLHP